MEVRMTFVRNFNSKPSKISDEIYKMAADRQKWERLKSIRLHQEFELLDLFQRVYHQEIDPLYQKQTRFIFPWHGYVPECQNNDQVPRSEKN